MKTRNLAPLFERNARVMYARTLGIVKPHTMKGAALEMAISVVELKTLVMMNREIYVGKRRKVESPITVSSAVPHMIASEFFEL